MMKNQTLAMLAVMTASVLFVMGCSNSSTSSQDETDNKGDIKNDIKNDIKVPSQFEPLMTEEGLREHARVEDRGHGILAPLPKEKVRVRRRLDLDQLDASIRRVTGGIGWTEMRGSNEVNLFDELSETLGKPDYISSTNEDLDPSIIFQKFLGDAARSVCDKLVEREVNALNTETKYLFVKIRPNQNPADEPTAARENLRALLLRFHGRFTKDDNDPRLTHWQWLLDSSIHSNNDAHDAWRTVCVGLITHPDFYTY